MNLIMSQLTAALFLFSSLVTDHDLVDLSMLFVATAYICGAIKEGKK